MLLEIAYRLQAQKIKSQKLQGFSTNFKEDVLQEAYLSLMETDLAGKTQKEVSGLMIVAYKKRLINFYEKENRLNDRAIDWREGAKSQAVYENFRREAVKILTKNQLKILDYTLSGYLVKEIAEVMGKGIKTIQKTLARIIDRLGLYFTSTCLDCDISDSGKAYFTESDLIYMMDNKDLLLDQL